MLVAIHQPNLLPRAKVLQKLALADLWIVLDDVQFSQRDYQHRAYIVPTALSQPARWLTLPVHLANGQTTLIREVEPAADPARRLQELSGCLFPGSNAAGEVVAAMNAGLNESDLLSSLGISAARYFMTKLGRVPRIARASELRGSAEPKSLGLLQLLREVDADGYVVDSGAAAYLDEALFERSGISLLWQRWSCSHSGSEAWECRNGAFLNKLVRNPQRPEGVAAGTFVAFSRKGCLDESFAHQ